jgi:hypothetical protein|nr:MAG TPA: minor capsid protein [Caudoviricetes sp.]
MITPDYLAYQLDTMRVQEELETSILQDIARRITKTNLATDTASYQAEILQHAGMLYEDIIKKVAKATKKTEDEIRALFKDAETEIFEYPSATLEANGINPAEFRRMSPQMQRIWDAALSKTTTEAKNLTKTTAATSQSLYISACDLAHMQVASGAMDYRTAITNAIRMAVQQGARVVYPSGHTTSLDAAVRRAVLTGVNQTAGRLQEMRAGEMGVDLMELSAHAGARPSHAAWQGQVVSLSGRRGYLTTSDIGYGDPGGFMGANCRHTWHLIFEGDISTYTQADLEEMKNQTVIYEGKAIPEYEASQKQRRMERSIRKTRQELVSLDAAKKQTKDATLNEALQNKFNEVSVRLKKKEARLADFCEQTGRYADTMRVQVMGYDRSVSGKVIWANRRNIEKYAKIQYNKDGTIKVTDTAVSTRAKYKPNAVVNRPTKKGNINRDIYDEEGNLKMQIHTSNHGNPKKHPYGESGEHGHNIIWEDGEIVGRPARDLTKKERKEHGDIL